MKTKEDFFTDRSLSRAVLKEALDEAEAAKIGILRGGGGREKKADLCAISLIFRRPQASERTGISRLNVGARELLWEFQPGELPPSYLRLRVVGGECVNPAIVGLAAQSFLSVKSTGIFESDFPAGVRESVKAFVGNVYANMPLGINI